ncbi:hypothetical protein THAOC_23187 [Thalassiosira oceanica]|uniref:Uncharacterized protein n=1 Tax=Thalassiosira oceanica TaxID=159749 RepID=K0RWK9_THAOC|nr:hypothetical protein THAOC_23187 [Thalassiosira oceanica]|eukprot:EJK56844.1 hypothetical protein THAOC_23187 [Thalassiosira oceanica]
METMFEVAVQISTADNRTMMQQICQCTRLELASGRLRSRAVRYSLTHQSERDTSGDRDRSHQPPRGHLRRGLSTSSSSFPHRSSRIPSNDARNPFGRTSPPMKEGDRRNRLRDTITTSALSARLQKCKSIPATIQVVHENLECISPRETIQFWGKLSVQLRNNHLSRQTLSDEQRFYLEEIMRFNYGQLRTYKPEEVADIAQMLARCAKNSGIRAFTKDPSASQAVLLYNLIMKNEDLWARIQQQSVGSLDSLPTKQVVGLAWAFGTVISSRSRHSQRDTVDMSHFFRAANMTFSRRGHEFTIKQMGNLAFQCAVARQKIPGLYNSISKEFSARAVNEGRANMADPTSLCMLANAYVKAGHLDKNLFQVIGDAAVPILPTFDARNIANLVHSFAKAEVVPIYEPGKCTLFDMLADSALSKDHDMQPQNIANILWAFAKMKHPSPKLFEELSTDASRRMHDFSAQQLATLAWSLSKYPPESSEVFDVLAAEVVARGLEKVSSQGLVMLAHAFATIGHTQNEEFWSLIVDAAISRASNLWPIECAQLSWSLATVRRKSDELMNGIEKQVLRRIDGYTPQGLASVAWSFSTLGYDVPNLYDALAKRSLQLMEDFSPTDKVLLVLAYSNHTHPHPNLLDAVASNTAAYQLRELSALALFNLSVSYGKSGLSPNDEWMDLLAREIVRRPSSFSPKMIVGIAFAYSTMNYQKPRLFTFLAEQVKSQCQESLEPKELASLVWSFVNIGFLDRGLLAEIAEVLNGKWSELDTQSLANVAWAYSKAQEDRPALYKGISAAAKAGREGFTAQGVSNLLWAFSAAGEVDDDLFEFFAPVSTSLLDEFQPQGIANLAWAYAVANVDDGSLFNADFIGSCTMNLREFDAVGLCQLHLWNMWRHEARREGLPAGMAETCKNAFVHQKKIRQSKLQNTVVGHLRNSGMDVIEEVQVESGYLLDVLLTINGKKIGVEIDGPFHFVGRRQNGATILKRRLVSNVDKIPIISLPYWELNGLDSDVEWASYLNRVLEDKSSCTYN